MLTRYKWESAASGVRLVGEERFVYLKGVLTATEELSARTEVGSSDVSGDRDWAVVPPPVATRALLAAPPSWCDDNPGDCDPDQGGGGGSSSCFFEYLAYIAAGAAVVLAEAAGITACVVAGVWTAGAACFAALAAVAAAVSAEALAYSILDACQHPRLLGLQIRSKRHILATLSGQYRRISFA
jgi:hypothetical protein